LDSEIILIEKGISPTLMLNDTGEKVIPTKSKYVNS
jgi:hypothetical protein